MTYGTMRGHGTMNRQPQKKSGRLPHEGNRSAAPRIAHKIRKRGNIIHRIFRKINTMSTKELIIYGLAVLGALFPVYLVCEALTEEEPAPVIYEPPVVLDTVMRVEYIFRTEDGTAVNMQTMTNAWAAEAGYENRYDLTDEERWEVASVVTAEAAGEPYAGKIAVAQCILQACEDDGIRPMEAVKKYGYTTKRPEPTAEVLDAVQAVFDFGQVATTEPIKFYYAPALVYSEWHESQEYVMTVNGHRFYKEAE